MTERERIAMQTRCINCFKEQYAIAVYAISHGEHPCVWCGHTPEPMTQDKYDDLIKKWRQSKEKI